MESDNQLRMLGKVLIRTLVHSALILAIGAVVIGIFLLGISL